MVLLYLLVLRLFMGLAAWVFEAVVYVYYRLFREEQFGLHFSTNFAVVHWAR